MENLVGSGCYVVVAAIGVLVPIRINVQCLFVPPLFPSINFLVPLPPEFLFFFQKVYSNNFSSSTMSRVQVAIITGKKNVRIFSLVVGG